MRGVADRLTEADAVPEFPLVAGVITAWLFGLAWVA
jgi:hypothetical protein